MIDKIKGLKKVAPSSKELEKVFIANEKNVSRYEIYEKEMEYILIYNTAINDVLLLFSENEISKAEEDFNSS